jgi:hypothetical protein
VAEGGYTKPLPSFLLPPRFTPKSGPRLNRAPRSLQKETAGKNVSPSFNDDEEDKRLL